LEAVLTYLDRATADVRYYADEWLIVYQTTLPPPDESSRNLRIWQSQVE
jgi:hypothetical protein